jgi:MFS family permease
VAEEVIAGVDRELGIPPRARLISFAPLRHPAYARLWTGAFVSNIGTWMESIALGIYVTKHTNQAAWTGTVAAAAFLPIAFLSPIGGALADRFPRRLLMIVTSLVQTALAGLLTFLFVVGHPSAPTITLIALGNGVCAALGFPSFQAMLPDLVPVEDLPGAIALSSAQYNLGRVIGPAIAGIVIAIGGSAHGSTRGYALAEGINAVSFLAVVAVMLTLTLPAPSALARAEKFFSSIADGFRFVRREPGLRVTALAMCLNTFLAAPFIALVPAMALKVLDSGSGGTAVLITAQGIGAVLMAFSLGSLVERYGARRVLMTLMSLLPMALAAYGAAPDLAISALALFFVGILYLGALSSFTTIAQLRVPSEIRGRVLAVFTVILGALYPLGSVVQGKIADRVGLRGTTVGAAALMALVMVVTRVARPGISAAIDAPVD